MIRIMVCLTHIIHRRIHLLNNSGTSSNYSSFTRKSSSNISDKDDNPYDASSYSDAEDFYYNNYDDFWDYEDAEDYYNEYGKE